MSLTLPRYIRGHVTGTIYRRVPDQYRHVYGELAPRVLYMAVAGQPQPEGKYLWIRQEFAVKCACEYDDAYEVGPGL